MTVFRSYRLRLAGAAIGAALIGAAPAHAIDDPVIDAAIVAGQVGETTEGYLRIVEGQTVSQAVRDRLNQNEAGRRAAYQESARRNGVPMETFAQSTACTLIPKNTPEGAMYRDQAGQWRRNSGGPVLPDYCTRPS